MRRIWGLVLVLGAGCGVDEHVPPETVPAAPKDLRASDGTSAAAVRLTWSTAEGAATYRVYRDGEVIAEVASTTYDDAGASQPPPSAPTDVTASQGTHTDRVEVTWSPSMPEAGDVHVYAVGAANDHGESSRSGSDPGHRAAAPITGYEVTIDGSAVVSAGPTTTFPDTNAPLGSIVPGVVAATDGASETAVELTGAEASVTTGAFVSYTVRAVSDAGTSEPSAAVTGHRGVGALTYQWQRSAAASDADHSNIVGATSLDLADLEAPSDGARRYYRYVASAPGAAAATSPSDPGYRWALPGTPRDDTWFGYLGPPCSARPRALMGSASAPFLCCSRSRRTCRRIARCG